MHVPGEEDYWGDLLRWWKIGDDADDDALRPQPTMNSYKFQPLHFHFLTTSGNLLGRGPSFSATLGSLKMGIPLID